MWLSLSQDTPLLCILLTVNYCGCCFYLTFFFLWGLLNNNQKMAQCISNYSCSKEIKSSSCNTRCATTLVPRGNNTDTDERSLMEKYQEEASCQSASLLFPHVMSYLLTAPTKSKAPMVTTREKNKWDWKIKLMAGYNNSLSFLMNIW